MSVSSHSTSFASEKNAYLSVPYDIDLIRKMFPHQQDVWQDIKRMNTGFNTFKMK